MDIALQEEKEKRGLIDTAKTAVIKVASAIGIKEENIGGTDANKEYVEELESGQEVLAEWNGNATVWSQLFSKMDEYRNFYLGENVEQGVSSLEGNIRVTANIGATIIDLFTYILANNPPEIQFYGDSTKEIDQKKADFKEDLTKRLFSDASFPKRFSDGAKTQFLIGWVLLYPFWNKRNHNGGDKGSFDISVLNPFTTRVKYRGDDYEQIESFITSKRVTQAEILKQYNYEAYADSEDPYIPKTIETQDDGMTTVFTRYGDEDIRWVINGREVKKVKHGLNFTPVLQINNIKVPNDTHGHSEIERWEGLAQEINALLSAASEIARDLAYPPILEYNNALAGRQIPKWRGQKIPLKRGDRGEGVEYMMNPAKIEPLVRQTQILVDLLHFVALMPKAAGGVFEANVTSGFQAKLAMQPSTLTIDNRKIDWEWGIKRLVKMAFMILKQNNPEALRIPIGTEKNEEFVEIEVPYDHEMKVVWPENLPVDIAREIQNLVLGLQNNLTSLHQGIDRYNVLMGLGSSSETMEFLTQEADDPTLGPERALKVKEVQQKIQEILTAFQGVNSQLDQIRGNMGGGNESLPPNLAENARQNNPVNLARSATSPLPEEQRNYSEGARGRVATESTGGVAIPPTVMGGK